MVTLSPRIGRLRAHNPSPMTLDGTNGYVVRVAPRTLVAIDPGPVDDAQRDAFLAAAHEANATYAAILVTHGHPDHFPGAAPLAAATGAPVVAHPLAAFPHDRAPADGEMRTYPRTLTRLRDGYGDAAAIYGGHGPEIRDVRAKFDEYIAHREAREQQIVDALGAGTTTIPALVERVYRDVDRRLWPAAARQVMAYLIALEAEGAVRSERVDRAPTAHEAALLNPDLSKLDDNLGADVIRAELGYGAKEPLMQYNRT